MARAIAPRSLVEVQVSKMPILLTLDPTRSERPQGKQNAGSAYPGRLPGTLGTPDLRNQITKTNRLPLTPPTLRPERPPAG